MEFIFYDGFPFIKRSDAINAMNAQNITVNEELLAYIDPLTQDETEALERSLLTEGCRDALVLWGDVLVDGHNRHAICSKHGIPFKTVQNQQFKSMNDVHLWMIEQHLGRRSLSDFQRGVLALRKNGILAARNALAKPLSAANPTSLTISAGDSESDAPLAVVAPEAKISRETIAREARISSNTVSQIEKIQKSAAPELVAAVKAGTVSINAAATVALLPIEEQVAAVAGGKKEMQLAARQVRAARSALRNEPETQEALIVRLKRTVVELMAENVLLKEKLGLA